MSWEADYPAALAAFVADPGEAERERAYEVGRAAIDARAGIVDVVLVHQRCVGQLPPGPSKGDPVAFLAECLAPFEMGLRGYAEANAALQDMNATLERRVADRTRELGEAEERYRSLVERLPVVTYLSNVAPPFPVVYASPQLDGMLGIERRDWTETPDGWRRSVLEADRERAVAERKRAVDTRSALHSEYRLVGADGRVVWVRDEAAIVSTPDGEPVHLQGVLLDVTEHKQLEEQFRQAQRAESIGRLAGGIAHDFNNLLSIILSYAEILLRRLPDGDATRKDIEEIRRAGERAASLTSKLLAYSRRQILESRVVALNTLIRDMEGMLRRVIGEDIELQADLAEDLFAVRVDPGQIEQVLLNLVVNARDAMPNGGVLRIVTRNTTLEAEAARASGLPAGDYAVMSVSDDGTGMTEDVKARLFEPFFTTKERGKGTGLGLATSYGIVKQSGGHVTVDSELGRGSTFRVLLPRVAGRAEPEPARRRGPRAVGGSETVLLVEDEPGVRKVAGRALREHGYHVLQAADGIEALVVANAFPDEIELLLTDVVMPGMNGKELAELMRAARPGIKVLFTSGYDEDAAARGALGEEHVLQKPFTPSALVERVRNVLDA